MQSLAPIGIEAAIEAIESLQGAGDERIQQKALALEHARYDVLKHGLALVLVFVGLKMVWLDHLYGGRFPIGVSLAIISGVIAVSILLSLAFPKAVEPAPARPSGAGGGVARPAAGVIFLLLSMVGFLYAAGPGHSLLPLAALDDLDAGTLYWAAACNLVCAVLLLGGTWVRTPLLRFGRAPLALAGESACPTPKPPGAERS